MLLGAILAFVPVLAVDLLLDDYVRAKETARLQRSADIFTRELQVAISASMQELRTLVAESPSLCTPTFTAKALYAIETSHYVMQFLVENSDGLQYCDAYGRQVDYSPLSATLSLPGEPETMSVVMVPDLDGPAIKISSAYGVQRQVSTFTPIFRQEVSLLAEALPAGAMMRLSLTNGTAIETLGDATAYNASAEGGAFITAEAYAGHMPLKVEYAAPFHLLRADYADLDVSFTVIACLMSAAFLMMSLQYVRRSQLPAFDLERAIAAGEIKPFYQPVINIQTGRLAGCEVLARWEKRNGQVIPPGTFIDYAEITGLAFPMTLSIMEQVRADLNELCQEMSDIKISINLFDGHFRDGSIVEDVKAIFGGSSIGFRQLVFEITERRPLGNTAQANSVISGLHALGARLAMDDAGTGHSNLAYLQTLGVDIIKVDQVFVAMIKEDVTQVPVLDGLIAMAHDLGTEIVAEGVETEAQAKYLRSRGVAMAQGYLFAPALRAGAFREVARALNGHTAAPGRGRETLAPRVA